MANLGTGNDNINIDGATSEFVDFGGTDTYTILNSLSGDVTITDNQASTFNLPGGLTITDAAFLADGVQFTINGFTLTLIGNPSLFTFVFGGTPLDPTDGTPQTFEETAVAFGTTVPATGEPANTATTTGEINGDGTVGGDTPPDATFALAAGATSVDEGASATFTVTTTNIAEGTEVAYTISGVDAADVTGGLTGTATVGADGTATITVPVVADAATEGAETLTVTLDADATATANVTVNDTSTAVQTVDLTVGVDTVPGSAGDDVINGVVSALSSTATLNPTDQIDGAGGTGDMLKVDMQGNFTGFTGAGFLKNVEMVELTNTGTILRSFDATGATGVTSYDIKGSVNLADLDNAATTVSLSDRASTDFTATYTKDAVKGTTDTLNLTVNNVGTVKADKVTENDVTVTAAGIEAVALTATGANVLDMNAADATSLTVSGAGSLKLTDVGAKVKTIDAAAATGALELLIDDATGITTLATGSGDDKVTGGFPALVANATVSGGAGKDTLTLNDGGGTAEFAMSGFETLALDNLSAAATLSLKNTSGLETIAATNKLDEDVILANAQGDIAVNLQGANANTKTLTVDHDGAVTVNVDTPASTATNAAPSVNALSVTATKAQNVALNVADKMSYTGTVDASKATSATVSIDGNTNGATVNAAEASSVVVSKVANDSSLDINAAKASQVDITNAKNLDLSNSDFSKAEVFSSSGAGMLKATGTTALSAVNQATITNTGDVELGNFGSTTQDYALNLTSTGAKSFIGGTLDTLNQAITASVTGALGTVKLGDATSGTAATSVTVGATGDTTIGAISSSNVTVDLSGVLGETQYGNITATGNVTIVGSGLKTNDLDGTNTDLGGAAGTSDIDLTGAAGSTQTVSLTGGIDDDTFLINTAAVAQTVNVTGNLNIQATGGKDTVSVVGGADKQTISLSGLTNYEEATIDAKAGADAITLGSGKDTIITTEGESVASTATTFAGANLAVGDTITFGNGVDTITGFTAGATGDVLKGVDAAALPTTGIGVAVATGFQGDTFFVSGAFNSGTGVFTVAADGAGADTMILDVENHAADLATVDDAVILIGVDSDDLNAANFAI